MCVAVGVSSGGAAARAAHGGVQQYAGVHGVAGAADAAAPPAARAAGARAPPPPLHRARHAHESQVRAHTYRWSRPAGPTTFWSFESVL